MNNKNQIIYVFYNGVYINSTLLQKEKGITQKDVIAIENCHNYYNWRLKNDQNYVRWSCRLERKVLMIVIQELGEVFYEEVDISQFKCKLLFYRKDFFWYNLASENKIDIFSPYTL